MAVAIIAALGTIAVTLLSFFTQRIQSRDLRVKLEKDLELLDKLDKDSLEYNWLAQHIQRSIFILVEYDKGIRPISMSIPLGLLLLGVLIFAYWLYLTTTLGASRSPFSIFLITASFVFYFAGLIAFAFRFSRRRQIREVKSVEDILESEIVKFESSKTSEPAVSEIWEPAVSEPWVKKFWRWLISAIRRAEQH